MNKLYIITIRTCTCIQIYESGYTSNNMVCETSGDSDQQMRPRSLISLSRTLYVTQLRHQVDCQD